MAFLNKEYKYEKHENFDAFLKTAGVTGDEFQKFLDSKPTAKLVKNGDSYTYTYVPTGPDGLKENTFKSGVEFEDNIEGLPVKTTYTVDGNTISQVVKTDKGEDYFKREYTGDKLVVTITSSIWNGVAKIYYKA